MTEPAGVAVLPPATVTVTARLCAVVMAPVGAAATVTDGVSGAAGEVGDVGDEPPLLLPPQPVRQRRVRGRRLMEAMLRTRRGVASFMEESL